MMRRSQQGYLMMVAVFLIMIIGFLGVAVAWMVSGSANDVNRLLLGESAFYLAQSGLGHATHKLLAPTVSDRSTCSGLSISNTLGAGAYTVTGSGPYYVSSPTTLSAALTATATTIPVVSTTGYQASGRILIDSELISYAAVTSTSFTGAERGLSDSVAAAHSSGIGVGQYQCNLTSQGGVPSLAAPANPGNPVGMRTVQQSIQLEQGFAVGIGGALMGWNYPTEDVWTYGTSAPGSVNGISMLSSVDGWNAGNAGVLMHWNGSAWSQTSVTPAVNYYDVFCSASNNCQAVGDVSSSKPAILHWNGTSWAQIVPGGTVAATILYGVHCATGTDCWAVGDNASGTNIFYHYNGTTWTGVNVSTGSNTVSSTSFPFTDVFCTSTSNCWAVGGNGTFAFYNGTTWTAYVSGMPWAGYGAVYCNNASDCWSAGDYVNSDNSFVHWNGSAWSLNSSVPSNQYGILSMTCTGTNDCWAGGFNNSTRYPVILHWDGNSWVEVTINSPVQYYNVTGIAIFTAPTEPGAAWEESFP